MAAREGTGLKELVALLGDGAEFSGKLLFEGRVRIDGKFTGEIASDDVLIVGSQAEVEAKIDVGSLIVLGGTVRGEIRAAKSVELHAPAKVYGNITTPQLMIDRGVHFEGQSRIPSVTPRLPEPVQGAETPKGDAGEPAPTETGQSKE
ncbi:MAG: polymer-forming cytoskeletal protein [Myxococcales bacterium]